MEKEIIVKSYCARCKKKTDHFSYYSSELDRARDIKYEECCICYEKDERPCYACQGNGCSVCNGFGTLTN